MGARVRQQRRDGKWYLDVIHAGQRAAKKFDTEEEAETVAKAVRNAIAIGAFDIAALKASRASSSEVKTPGITLKQFYDETVVSLWESSLARATYQSYEGSFRVHVLPAFENVAIEDITRDRIREFIKTLRKKQAALQKKSTEAKPRLLSKESIRNIVASLRSALTEAVEKNLIPANPAMRLGKFYKEAQNFHEEIDPYSAEEVSLLLSTMREKFGYENYALLLTLFHCGLRAGEAAGLYWSDLDIRNHALLVRRQYTRGRVGKTKTGKRRSVDVSTTLLAELQALRKRRQAEYFERGETMPESIFLSPGNIIWEDGKPVGREERRVLDMNGWRNRVYWKACDKAGIRRRRLHDTRHTFASLLLNNGESLKYISSQLGHSSIRITADVYGHLEVGSNRAAMDRLPILKTQAGASSDHQNL